MKRVIIKALIYYSSLVSTTRVRLKKILIRVKGFIMSKLQNAFSGVKGKVLAVSAVVVAGATQASAALTIAPIATTDFETIAAAVVVATGVFFGIRKAMGLLR